MTIEQNVAQRKSAIECLEFVAECAGEFGGAEHFWMAVRDGASEHLPPPKVKPSEQPMTVEEAAKFSRSLMPFGAHRDQPVGDVPLERLAWYTDQDWTRQAMRYLRSPDVAKEFRKESEAENDHS